MCANFGATQLVGGMAYCVASVLPPSNVTSYGPKNFLDGIGQTAGCEDNHGHGVGQRIAIYIHNSAPFRQLPTRIGYGKSGQTYGRNSRPSLVRITTDKDTTHDVNLPDYHGDLTLPKGGSGSLGNGLHRWTGNIGSDMPSSFPIYPRGARA